MSLAASSAASQSAAAGVQGSAPAHTVRSGETLSAIAERYGVSVGDLLAANRQITNPNLIHPGQTVTLPAGAAEGRAPYRPRRPPPIRCAAGTPCRVSPSNTG